MIATAMPFALLFSALCIRKVSGFLMVPVVAAIWPMTFFAAIALSGPLGKMFALGTAGLGGALGVGIIGSVLQRRLRSLYALSAACIAGFLGVIPFALREGKGLEGAGELTRPELLFMTWQTAVGVVLYAASVRRHQQ